MMGNNNLTNQEFDEMNEDIMVGDQLDWFTLLIT
jgi:hypothetical protein